MIKLLIGGSPCTYWSIAQTQHRETEASGMGWELFKNFLIAREKYHWDAPLLRTDKRLFPSIHPGEFWDVAALLADQN